MRISRQKCDHLPELWVTLDPCGFRESEKAAPKTRIIENEDAEPVRSSEREPADSLRDKSNVIGGWLPSLTFALANSYQTMPTISKCPPCPRFQSARAVDPSGFSKERWPIRGLVFQSQCSGSPGQPFRWFHSTELLRHAWTAARLSRKQIHCNCRRRRRNGWAMKPKNKLCDWSEGLTRRRWHSLLQAVCEALEICD